jgi:hypothetical protein
MHIANKISTYKISILPDCPTERSDSISQELWRLKFELLVVPCELDLFVKPVNRKVSVVWLKRPIHG